VVKQFTYSLKNLRKYQTKFGKGESANINEEAITESAIFSLRQKRVLYNLQWTKSYSVFGCCKELQCRDSLLKCNDTVNWFLSLSPVNKVSADDPRPSLKYNYKWYFIQNVSIISFLPNRQGKDYWRGAEESWKLNKLSKIKRNTHGLFSQRSTKLWQTIGW